jgi:hypothetical protein
MFIFFRWAFVLIALPSAGIIFVLFMYYGSRIINPWTTPGDCTKWIQFKDAKLQESYKGKRIDIETMYEMYFNSELDFKEQDLMEVFKHRSDILAIRPYFHSCMPEFQACRPVSMKRGKCALRVLGSVD